MDIISHYSAYTLPSAAGQARRMTSDAKAVSGEDFLKQAKERLVRAPDAGQFLYNGSETRTKLSDTEVAVLANKYDPHNMDQDTYDRFLDDLQGMGAISELEKRQLGYNGWQLIAYKGADGETYYCGDTPGRYNAPESKDLSMCCIIPWEGETDLHKWLGDRVQGLPGSYSYPNQEAAEAYMSLLKNVFGIVDRMAVRQEEDAGDKAKAGLVCQLADKNSDFYTNMRTALKMQVDKNKEDEEEQAIIDAMAAVLDAMSGRETVAGEKMSVNKTASDLTKKIGEKISRLRLEDPNNPEIVKLENMLKRLQEMGIYVDLGDTDDLWQDEDETFETLTQFLIRRQAEETSVTHPNVNEVNEPE